MLSRSLSSSAGTCRWIPWAFAGALGLVVLANGALTYFAVTSNTGLVTEHPFDEGNSYNRVLAAAAAEDALGWNGKLGFSGAVAAPGRITAELTDRSGRALTGLSVTAHITRPVEPLPEIVLPLAETAGSYAAPVTLSRPGQWEVRITARRSDDLFEFAQRIIVK